MSKKYVMVEDDSDNGKLGWGILVFIFCSVSVFMYAMYDWTWDEFPEYAMVKYIQAPPIPFFHFLCVKSNGNEDGICDKQSEHMYQDVNKRLNRIRNKRELRIANSIEKSKEIRRLNKIKYGIIKEDSMVFTYKSSENMVDMRDILSDYKNIGYKEDRTYLINRKAIENKNFKSAMDEINRTMNITITETTLGKHVVSEYSHSTGYKIDIRTKDLTYGEIGNVMKLFKKYDFLVAFEYDESEESQEIAEKISNKTSFIVRKSDNGEHIDIDLSRNSNGNLRF